MRPLEDALTVWLQCAFGWRFVRGGNRVATSEKGLRKWLHPLQPATWALLTYFHCIRLPMGKFVPELRDSSMLLKWSVVLRTRIILDSDVLAGVLLGAGADHLHHVLARQLVAVALRAEQKACFVLART